ncbi:MAG: T9SS type A sorting domain-containing protein [Ignavibacteria bacterium]
MKAKILILALLTLSSNILQAEWTPTNGPQGGGILNLYSNSNYIFSSVYGAGIFRSSNMGTNWQEKNVGIQYYPWWGPTFEAFTVFENKILIGGSNRIYMSSNFGDSWTEFGTPLPHPYIASLAVKDNFIFVAVPPYGIYRTSDYGTSWMTVNNGLPSYLISDIKNAGNALIAACGDGNFGGIFRSTDYGNSWERTLNTNMSFSGISRLCVDENNSNRIFGAGFMRGVYMSTNNGINWISIYGPSDVFSIAFSDPYLFAGTLWSGIFRTTNLGVNWTVVNTGLQDTKVRTILIRSGTVYAGTEYRGIYKSTNWGELWEEANSGINGINVRCMKQASNIIYAGTFGTWVYVTTNLGQSWQIKNSGLLSSSIINALAIRDNYVYAGTSDYKFGIEGIFISSDYGESWRLADSAYECEDIAVLDNYIFAGTSNKGIRRSTNNGVNWHNANNGLPLTHILHLAVIDTLVFVSGTSAGVYRSTNKGDSWISVSNGLPSSPPDCIKSNGQSLYLSIGSGKFYSSNYGNTWIQLGNTTDSFSDFEFYQNHIFGASAAGVYHSSDNGYHWRMKSDGLSVNKIVTSLVIANGYLYAGLSYASVWKISISDIIGINKISSRIPESYNLYQNYPNPFNPVTYIEFDIPQNSYTTLVIYDILGRIIYTPVNEFLNAGSYKVKFDGSELSSGIYFYSITSNNFVKTKKMLLLK